MNSAGPCGPALFVYFKIASNDLEIDRFGALLVRLDVEGHMLAFIEAPKSRGLHSGDVDKHILAAAFRRDESKTLGGIEKFDLAGRHLSFLLKEGFAADTMFAVMSKPRLFQGKRRRHSRPFVRLPYIRMAAHDTSPARAASAAPI
jgi:hypothetical protein